MTQDEFDSLQGQTLALSNVLTSLIASLPRPVAMEMQVKLLGERIENMMRDEEEPPVEAERRGRYLVLDGYLELLEAVVKRG